MPDIILLDEETRNAQLTALVAKLDGGSGNAKLKLGTASMAVTAVVITLNKPCGTVSAGSLTISGLPKSALSTAVGHNVLVAATLTDSNDVVRVSGMSIGETGSDSTIIIQNANVNEGQEVIVNNPAVITL